MIQQKDKLSKKHTEVSVANLGINLATTKYIFLLKEGDFLSQFIDFFDKLIDSICKRFIDFY
jgi:hypothetical protein